MEHYVPEEGLTTHQIIEQYPEPKPAYSTIATFLKILVNKGFVGSRKQEGGGKTLVFFPLLTREEYTNRVMKEVKSTFFAGSLKTMLSFFARQEEVSEEDLKEIISLIKSK
ncbi:MAG: BlaI/MecI/CopY family transcriptional regulator [Bacteroidaceae bacterium]|nr:BlaI/MecI/CopY family transcriptional regulator [Bacteroidaceae bacterium]